MNQQTGYFRWLPQRALGPVAILCVALLALGANPFAAQTVGPFDLLTHMSGWDQRTLAEVRNVQRSDILDWQLPQWQWAKEQLRAGEWPIWNWGRGGGVPGFFDLSTGMATPSFAVFAAFDDTASGVYWSTLLRLLIAGLGMYLLLRFELTRLPALFGAVTFMFSGFFTAWLYWPQTTTLMWFPWLLLAIFRFLDWLTLARWFAITAASLALALGGFPSVAAYCFYACGLAQLVFGLLARWSVAQHVKSALLTGGALLSALALAAPWMAGLAEVLAHVDVSYRGYGSSGDLRDLALSLLPMRAYFAADVESARYVGTAALVLAVLGCGLFWLRPRAMLLPCVGLVFTATAVVFVAGVVPADWVARIPALNNSPWDRLASILGVGLALLAATGAAVLMRLVRLAALRLGYPAQPSQPSQPSHPSHLARWLVAGLLVVQLADQISYFRTFNGPVDAQLAYPTTDAINHVVHNQLPLQTTVADDAFLVAGTLNYFGISEWFAHGFKAPHEQQLLQELGNELFVTKTAAQFPLNRIDMTSPLASALGVRYFIGHSLGHSLDARHFGLQGHQPAPPLPAAKWRQTFVLTEPTHIYGIELVLATYGAATAPAPVQIVLRSGATELRSATVGASAIADNAAVYFEFNESVELAAGEYEFSVELQDYAGTERLTAWSAPATDQARLHVDGKPGALSIKFSLATQIPAPLSRRRFDQGISVIENHAVTSNAYFVGSLTADPTEVVYSSATQAVLEPDQSITLTYTGRESGWVVLPIRNLPGFTASIAEKTIAISTYLGVLPAFFVQGADEGVAATTIRYGYSSGYIAKGAQVALAMLLMLTLVGTVGVWRGRRGG